MRKNLACFLLLSSVGCLDYEEPQVAETRTANYFPFIDKSSILPDPVSVASTDRIPMGLGCRSQFTIPRIKDFNVEDDLYYLWFFDNHFMQGKHGQIKAENRNRAIITLIIDRDLLESQVGQTLNDAFFAQRHILQFFVADRPYQVLESHYYEEGALEDTVYWNLSFSNLDC